MQSESTVSNVICGLSGCTIFFPLNHKSHDFLEEEEVIEHKMRVFIFSAV